jgi:hypothetical protein
MVMIAEICSSLWQKWRNLDIQEFHQISDQTLDSLSEILERLVELDHPKVTGWDVDYSVSCSNLILCTLKH